MHEKRHYLASRGSPERAGKQWRISLYAAQADGDKMLIRLWLDGRSLHTRRAYEGDARTLLAAAGKPIGAITLGDLQAWVASTLPPSVALRVLGDRTQTIRASVAGVQLTMAISIGLVVLVVFLFLRHAAATLIPSVAIPAS